MTLSVDFEPAKVSRRTSEAKLMVIDNCRPNPTLQRLNDLPDHLNEGDVLIFNDAATIPGSILLDSEYGPLEIRLISNEEQSFGDPHNWLAMVYLGEDWRIETENRAFLKLKGPMEIPISAELGLKINASGNFYRVAFHGSSAAIWKFILESGSPIQYSYHEKDLQLWDVQTIFANRPIALEAPSAALHFDWQLLRNILAKGISVGLISHAAGVSATGLDPVDEKLPLDERYFIPQRTIDLIEKARQTNGHKRIIAVGTSATRALESCVHKNGFLAAGEGVATLKLHGGYPLKVVDGLITGFHEFGSTHNDLMQAFLGERLLFKAHLLAQNLGYLSHEFGDLELLTRKCC